MTELIEVKTAELKALAEACITAGEYLPAEAWEEDRSYSASEVAWLEFAAQATPAAILSLLGDIDRLRGLRPGLPPRPPDGEGLPRFGLRWNGPQQPLAVPMMDGYWTPWHLAERLREDRDALLEAGAHLL